MPLNASRWCGNQPGTILAEYQADTFTQKMRCNLIQMRCNLNQMRCNLSQMRCNLAQMRGTG